MSEEVVPYIRYGDQWIPLSDLTPEQITYLRESMEKVLPADVEEMMARAWDQGYATGVIDQSRWEGDGVPDGGVQNPFRGLTRG